MCALHPNESNWWSWPSIFLSHIRRLSNFSTRNGLCTHLLWIISKANQYHSFASQISAFWTSFYSLGTFPPYLSKVATRTFASSGYSAAWALTNRWCRLCSSHAFEQCEETGTVSKEGGNRSIPIWTHQCLQDSIPDAEWLCCLWQEQLLKILFMAEIRDTAGASWRLHSWWHSISDLMPTMQIRGSMPPRNLDSIIFLQSSQCSNNTTSHPSIA